MTNDQALGALHMLLKNYEMERPITKKVLAALPDAGAGYRPDPKARTGMELAYHIAVSEIWFLNSIADGAFTPPSGPEVPPAELSKPSALPGWYEQETAKGLAKVKAMTGEQAAKILDFYGAFQMPAAVYLSFTVNHTAHHRGQLSTYLRPAGGKVPDIYGGSADEPWQG